MSKSSRALRLSTVKSAKRVKVVKKKAGSNREVLKAKKKIAAKDVASKKKTKIVKAITTTAKQTKVASKKQDLATRQLLAAASRLRYIQNWKKLKSSEAQKHGKKLRDYLDDLSKRHEDRFVLKIRELVSDADGDELGSDFGQFDEDSDRMDRYHVEEADYELESLIKHIGAEDGD